MNITATNTILYCSRWEETVEFYARGIGLEELTRNEWFVEFRLGRESRLSVANDRGTSITSAGGQGVTISIRVDDVVAARNELTGRGVAPGPLRAVWGARAFYVHDPEGTRIEFWS